jgi:hypothetical protein
VLLINQSQVKKLQIKDIPNDYLFRIRTQSIKAPGTFTNLSLCIGNDMQHPTFTFYIPTQCKGLTSFGGKRRN